MLGFSRLCSLCWFWPRSIYTCLGWSTRVEKRKLRSTISRSRLSWTGWSLSSESISPRVFLQAADIRTSVAGESLFSQTVLKDSEMRVYDIKFIKNRFNHQKHHPLDSSSSALAHQTRLLQKHQPSWPPAHQMHRPEALASLQAHQMHHPEVVVMALQTYTVSNELAHRMHQLLAWLAPPLSSPMAHQMRLLQKHPLSLAHLPSQTSQSF